jgi:hypothetical protein
MQSQSATYQYTNLDKAKDQIRLLSIHPAKDAGESINCSLAVVELAENLQYEALSYAWGDPARTHCIQLNGSHFNVTRSLGTALQYLRRTDAIRMIWIDAICINQDNITERSSQVLMMRNIYQRAWRVVVWLGNHDELTDHGLFRRFGHLYAVDGDVERSRDLEFWHLLAGTPETTATANYCAERSLHVPYAYDLPLGKMTLTEIELPFPRSHLQCLGRILARPYFSRLWIIQEVVLAKEVIAMVGDTCITWEGLGAASGILSRSVFLRTELHHADFITTICSNWKRPFKGRTFGFLDLLEITCAFKVSDERDRVVALIGIADDCGHLAFRPDYSKSPFDFYMDFTTAYAKDCRSRNSPPIPYASVESGLKFFPQDAVRILREERCICDGEEEELVLINLIRKNRAEINILKSLLADALPSSS